MNRPKPKTQDLRPVILLGLTTTPCSDWRGKIKEIDELNIQEIALFPTYLKSNDRQELYRLLENSKLKSIPHVHLRDDMSKNEVDYLTKRFKTKLFNIHPNKEAYASISTFVEYKDNIFLENLNLHSLHEIENNIEKVGGLCVDYSHWHNRILKNEKNYDSLIRKLIDNYKIGCCHISSIYQEPKEFDWCNETEPHYSGHYMYELYDLDYMKKYLDFLPEIISLELENSFKEQLEAKEYLEKLIVNSKKNTKLHLMYN